MLPFEASSLASEADPIPSIGEGFAPGVYEWRAGLLVRLDDHYRRTAVVIGSAVPGSPGSIDPWGSGFIAVDGIGGAPTHYLVTAAHVVHLNSDAPFDIRFNSKDGGAQTHHIDQPEWVFHPTDDTVDVAVHEIEIPSWASFSFVPISPPDWARTKHQLYQVGHGSRTYTVGLWKFLHGSERNQSYVYSGHIGLIPEGERIPVAGWLPSHGDRALVEAYLVEGEPLDGASGAPVFALRTDTVKVEEYRSVGRRDVREVPFEREVVLIGMQTDAWTGVPGKDYEVYAARDRITVPRGVNVVVPTKKISEVLHQPRLATKHAEKQEGYANSRLPKKTRIEPEFTAEEVAERRDRAIGRALNTPPQPKKRDGDG